MGILWQSLNSLAEYGALRIMIKLIEEIQKVNPGLSEKDVIRVIVDYASDNLDDIIAKLELPPKRTQRKKYIDELRLIQSRTSDLRKSEIRSKRILLDDLNYIREKYPIEKYSFKDSSDGK